MHGECPFYGKTKEEVFELLSTKIEAHLQSRKVTHEEVQFIGETVKEIVDTALEKHLQECPVLKRVSALEETQKLTRAADAALRERTRALEESTRKRISFWRNIAEIVVAIFALLAFLGQLSQRLG